MDELLSAAEAAQILRVSRSTLYSYVSRGLLPSSSCEGKRSKYYAKSAVLRLLARSTDSRRAGGTAQAAIAWGVPVLESRITQIADGKLRYRAHDMRQLAQHADLEQTAQILWEQSGADPFQARATAVPQELWSKLQSACASLPALNRAMAILSALTPGFPPLAGDDTAAWFASAAQLMRILAAALLGTEIQTQLLHRQITQAWSLTDQAADALRAALVACADHELNVSTFTVRCVASSGASLSAALCAGLAALSGPRHGGESLRVSALFQSALPLSEDAVTPYLAQRLRQAETAAGFVSGLPGFGHPLYPHGDPRAELLLSLLPEQRGSRVLALARSGQALSGLAPNLDFGLAALEYCYQLPPGAAQTLFALGRSAGWIAHAAEQINDGQLIRPRARYVGSFDFVVQ